MIQKIKIFGVIALLMGSVGCFKDLNTEPIDPDVLTAANVYKDPAAYKQVLAKLYAGFAVSGQQGPAGQADISGIDEGFGQYLRGFWYHQELSTDEAVIGWNDQTIKDFHSQTWTASDGFIYAFYSRIFYQISLANEFMRETTDEKLTDRGVDATLKAEIQKYRAEARYLRALSYWHALDLFRNPPFATEDNVVGTFTPDQTNANVQEFPRPFRVRIGEMLPDSNQRQPRTESVELPEPAHHNRVVFRTMPLQPAHVIRCVPKITSSLAKRVDFDRAILYPRILRRIE